MPRPSSKIMSAANNPSTVTDATVKNETTTVAPKADKAPKAPKAAKPEAPKVDVKARKAELKEALAKSREPLSLAEAEVKKLELQAAADTKTFDKARNSHEGETAKLVAARAKELAKLDKEREGAVKASNKTIAAAKAKVEKFAAAHAKGAEKINSQLAAL